MMTNLQREALDEIMETPSAISPESAKGVTGANYRVAPNLVRLGILNVRIDEFGSERFWHRAGLDEKATGTRVPAGFIVILNKDITERGGKRVNFFLGRTRRFDLVARRRSLDSLLAGWLKRLKLSPKDLSRYIAVEITSYDNGPFSNPDHIILESS